MDRDYDLLQSVRVSRGIGGNGRIPLPGEKREGRMSMAKLYGLGVGPGDPELMTLKAVRLIKECAIIAVPASGQDVNAALTIAAGAVPRCV